MYDFKHQNNLNSYKTYTKTIKKENSLNKVRNILFYIVILLFIFMAGVFLLKSYQSYNMNNETYVKKNSHLIHIDSEISHLQLTKAITQSVVKNLQSQRTLQQINDDELKNIIQKVVKKIEDKPHKTTYSQN